MSKQQKKLSSGAIVAIVLSALLFLWVLFSNTLISLALNRKNPVTRIYGTEDLGGAPVYYGLDLVDYQNDFQESFEISGWAFCESVEETEPENVYLLLLSNANSYKVPCSTSLRRDIYDSFKAQGHSLGRSNLGFGATFSTIGIKNGTYELGLLVEESSGISGVVRIGEKFVKTGAEAYQIEASPITLPMEPVQGTATRFAVDNFELDTGENAIEISGWGVAFGYASDEEKYLKVETEAGTSYYEITSLHRKDIANTFGQEYSLSGYSAVIPAEQISEGEINVSLVLAQDGTLFATEVITFEYKGGLIKKTT